MKKSMKEDNASVRDKMKESLRGKGDEEKTRDEKPKREGPQGYATK